MGINLNLGCGSNLLKGYVNVDVVPGPGIFPLDLDRQWPWGPESVTKIYAKDVFEHVKDPVHFMVSAHTVLREGCELTVIVPHYMSPDAFSDPTHRRFCTEQTMNHWIPGTPQYAGTNYGGVAFHMTAVQVFKQEGKIRFDLRKPAAP